LKTHLPKPRFGLIGTGAWARTVHAPAASSSRDIVFTSILGRREETTRSLAAEHHVQPFQRLEEFLETVDIVGIAVPPEDQPRFALAAAEAGKHVLLEKPVAVDLVAAETISAALASRGLASIVFFPQLLLPQVRKWIDQAIATGDWLAASLERFSQVLTDTASPFHGSAWRIGAGALWDGAPHAVALLLAVLEELVDICAVRGRGDLVSLTLVSSTGAIATVTLTRDAVTPLLGRTVLYGRGGPNVLPPQGDWNADSIVAYRSALRSLATAAKGELGEAIRCDAGFGARVTAVLAAATASLEERRFVRIGPHRI
jgi:predicted dehydrogenase